MGAPPTPHGTPGTYCVLGVDVGKSATRTLYRPHHGAPLTATGPGYQIGGEPDAVRGIVEALSGALPPMPAPPRTCLLALTGLPAQESELKSLLDATAVVTGAMAVACCPDFVAAHAGALAGPGVLLIAGTGAVAFGLDGAGVGQRVDGWGPHLGDDGGAYAIGRAGLRAAFAQADGRGPATSLHDRAVRGLGGVDYAAAYRLHTDTQMIAAMASFAPAVAEETRAGDAVAKGIWDSAVADLARTALRAAELTRSRVVSYSGRLFDSGALLVEPLKVLLDEEGVSLRAPAGTPLDGAVQLCLPESSRLYRAHLTTNAAWAAAR